MLPRAPWRWTNRTWRKSTPHFRAGDPGRSQHCDMRTVDPKEIKQRAVALGLRLGAADVRVVAARTDAESRHRMDAAFRRGDFAAWGYDGEYARQATDPTSLLQGARTVVCVAVPYATPPPNETAVLRG